MCVNRWTLYRAGSSTIEVQLKKSSVHACLASISQTNLFLHPNKLSMVSYAAGRRILRISNARTPELSQ